MLERGRRIRKLWLALQDKHIRKFKGKVRNYFNQYRKAQLDKLAKTPGIPRAADTFPPAEGIKRVTEDDMLMNEIMLAEREWDRKLQEMLEPLYESAAEDTLKYSKANYGIALDITDPAVIAEVKTSMDLVTQIQKTVASELRITLAQGLNQGETLQELMDRIRKTMNAANSRALTIARTETNAITGAVNRASNKKNGATHKRRITVGSGAKPPPRQTHLDDEGSGFIEVDKVYPFSGQMFVGDMSAGAGEACNCRCAEDYLFGQSTQPLKPPVNPETMLTPPPTVTGATVRQAAIEIIKRNKKERAELIAKEKSLMEKAIKIADELGSAGLDIDSNVEWIAVQKELSKVFKDIDIFNKQKVRTEIQDLVKTTNKPNIKTSVIRETFTHPHTKKKYPPAKPITKATEKKYQGSINNVRNHLNADGLSDETLDVVINRTQIDRAVFNPDSNRIIASPNYDHKMVVHEYGHQIQMNNPGISDAVNEFYENRTKGENAVKLADLFPDASYDKDEFTKIDKFFHPYVGRVAPGSGGEVVSMGIGEFFSSPEKLLEKDPEHFELIADILLGNIR